MPDTVEQTPDDVFRLAIVFETGLGVLALALGWLLGPDPRTLVPELDPDGLVRIGMGLLYGVIAAVPILGAVEVLRRLPWEPVRELERLSDDGMVKLLLKLGPLELALISICAGVGEELLFRGWMMAWMSGAGAQPTSLEIGVGLVGSAIAFGLVHPITKLYVVLATLMGIYFGGLLLISGNLLVPIAAHATYDAAQLILTARRDDAEPAEG